MTPYEIMLSESQERMLMVLEDGREAEALAVFAKWGLDFAVVGRVTDSGRMVLRWQGEIVADVPVAPVSGASPVYDRPHEPTPQRVPLAASDREATVPHREALLAPARLARPRQQALGLASSTTTWSWATRCSARAAMRRWSACTAPTAAWRSPPIARRAIASPTRSWAARRRWPRRGAIWWRWARGRWRSPTA